jgi:hypothetical protein
LLVIYYSFWYLFSLTLEKNGRLFSLFPFLLLCSEGVHYGIYKSSYNISNTFHPIHLFPLFPHPCSWNSFNRYYFSIYVMCAHSICTVFTLPHPFPISSPFSLVPTTTTVSPNPTGPALHPLFSNFVKKKKDIFVCLRELHREYPCDIGSYHLFFRKVDYIMWVYKEKPKLGNFLKNLKNLGLGILLSGTVFA